MKMRTSISGIAGLLIMAAVLLPALAGAQSVIPGVDDGPPELFMEEAPSVAVIPGTYVYFVPDLVEDIFFYHGRWYRPYNGRWYWGSSYNGPWHHLRRSGVPSYILNLPGDYRSWGVHERIHHDHFSRNWRDWERRRYWNKQDFWQRDRYRDRRDHDRPGLDRRDHDRSDRRRDDRGTKGGKQEIYQGFKMGDAIEKKNKGQTQQNVNQDSQRNSSGDRGGIYQGFKMGDAVDKKNKGQGQQGVKQGGQGNKGGGQGQQGVKQGGQGNKGGGQGQQGVKQGGQGNKPHSEDRGRDRDRQRQNQ